jgi:hypothetical protein
MKLFISVMFLTLSMTLAASAEVDLALYGSNVSRSQDAFAEVEVLDGSLTQVDYDDDYDPLTSTSLGTLESLAVADADGASWDCSATSTTDSYIAVVGTYTGVNRSEGLWYFDLDTTSPYVGRGESSGKSVQQVTWNLYNASEYSYIDWFAELKVSYSTLLSPTLRDGTVLYSSVKASGRDELFVEATWQKDSYRWKVRENTSGSVATTYVNGPALSVTKDVLQTGTWTSTMIAKTQINNGSGWAGQGVHGAVLGSTTDGIAAPYTHVEVEAVGY